MLFILAAMQLKMYVAILVLFVPTNDSIGVPRFSETTLCFSKCFCLICQYQ